jgi:hypothetical protein
MDMLRRKVLRFLILAFPLAVLMHLSAFNQAAAHSAMDHASSAGQAQYQTIGDPGAFFADSEPQISEYGLSGIIPFADRSACDGSSCCSPMCASSIHVAAYGFFIYPLNSRRVLPSNADGPMSLRPSGLERPPRSRLYAI